MILKSLYLNNFRNYDELEVNFHENLNVIYGNNGNGKTYLVEAIVYLSNLKSFRGVSDSNLIKFNKDNFVIKSNIELEKENKKLKVTYYENKRHLFLGVNEIKKSLDFIGNLNAIVFSPSDVSLFSDIPDRRRKFLDQELSKLSPSYLYSLSQYKNLLKEKNILLKENNIDGLYLDILTNKLASLSDYIISKRIEFIKNIKKYVNDIFKTLYNDFDIELDILYKSYKNDENKSINYFLEVKDKEIEKQKTLIGPHLDDFKVLLNNEDISLFGSQGQNRLAILSIKLGLLKFINESNYENAIVVLDDVLSELDINKRRSLLNLLSSSNQVFITTANKSDVENIGIKNVQYYEIVNGKIKEE